MHENKGTSMTPHSNSSAGGGLWVYRREVPEGRRWTYSMLLHF